MTKLNGVLLIDQAPGRQSCIGNPWRETGTAAIPARLLSAPGCPPAVQWEWCLPTVNHRDGRQWHQSGKPHSPTGQYQADTCCGVAAVSSSLRFLPCGFFLLVRGVSARRTCMSHLLSCRGSVTQPQAASQSGRSLSPSAFASLCAAPISRSCQSVVAVQRKGAGGAFGEISHDARVSGRPNDLDDGLRTIWLAPSSLSSPSTRLMGGEAGRASNWPGQNGSCGEPFHAHHHSRGHARKPHTPLCKVNPSTPSTRPTNHVLDHHHLFRIREMLTLPASAPCFFCAPLPFLLRDPSAQICCGHRAFPSVRTARQANSPSRRRRRRGEDEGRQLKKAGFCSSPLSIHIGALELKALYLHIEQ